MKGDIKMPEYLAPGVYVEEVGTEAQTIGGVSTTTTAMVGVTKRGPVDGLPPILITSFTDFLRKFGSYLGEEFQDKRYLAYAVEGFFQNGGKKVYIKRVPGKGSNFLAAAKTVKGGIITRVADDTVFDTDTDNDGIYDATARVKLESLRGLSEGTNLTFTQVINGAKTEEGPLAVSSYNSSKNEVTLSTPLTNRYQKGYTYVTVEIFGVSDPPNTPADTIVFKAKDSGSWGNEISIQIKHVSQDSSTVETFDVSTPSKIVLDSAENFYQSAVVEIDNGIQRIYREITDVDGRVLTLDNHIAATDAPTGAKVSTCEFSLVVSCKDEQETFDFLRVPTDATDADEYFEKAVNEKSELITIQLPKDFATTPPTPVASVDTAPFNQPSAENGFVVVLEGGGDGDAPDPDAYSGKDDGPGGRTGIKALVDIDEISIVAVPGVTDQDVHNALIIHCETRKDRFTILDPPKGQDILQLSTFRKNYDTKYAAIYYPWLKIKDPVTKIELTIPPSGHMAGIYARSDIESGVHKAPANEVIRGVTGLELTLNKAEQDILNRPPNQINVLRDLRKSGRGYRVWGARCITSDPDWKYINVRRLFIFVEESIKNGTQWVVFEPNDEPTWAKVRRSVSNFLTIVWRDGALQGTKPEEAFFVKCDRTTTTQTDINNGKLVMEIGIATVKPAEFVIFRIGQWSGGPEVVEL